MKNKATMTMLLSVVLVIAVAIFATAQRSTPSQGQDKSQQQSGNPPMSMDEMMQQCIEHGNSTTTMLESLIRQAEAAKKSNEVPKMRAALDNAQQQAQEMKKHMEMCTSMMNMMRKMNASMVGQKGQKAPANAPKK